MTGSPFRILQNTSTLQSARWQCSVGGIHPRVMSDLSECAGGGGGDDGVR